MSEVEVAVNATLRSETGVIRLDFKGRDLEGVEVGVSRAFKGDLNETLTCFALVGDSFGIFLSETPDFESIELLRRSLEFLLESDDSRRGADDLVSEDFFSEDEDNFLSDDDFKFFESVLLESAFASSTFFDVFDCINVLDAFDDEVTSALFFISEIDFTLDFSHERFNFSLAADELELDDDDEEELDVEDDKSDEDEELVEDDDDDKIRRIAGFALSKVRDLRRLYKE